MFCPCLKPRRKFAYHSSTSHSRSHTPTQKPPSRAPSRLRVTYESPLDGEGTIKRSSGARRSRRRSQAHETLALDDAPQQPPPPQLSILSPLEQHVFVVHPQPSPATFGELTKSTSSYMLENNFFRPISNDDDDANDDDDVAAAPTSASASASTTNPSPLPELKSPRPIRATPKPLPRASTNKRDEVEVHELIVLDDENDDSNESEENAVGEEDKEQKENEIETEDKMEEGDIVGKNLQEHKEALESSPKLEHMTRSRPRLNSRRPPSKSKLREEEPMETRDNETKLSGDDVATKINDAVNHAQPSPVLLHVTRSRPRLKERRRPSNRSNVLVVDEKEEEKEKEKGKGEVIKKKKAKARHTISPTTSAASRKNKDDAVGNEEKVPKKVRRALSSDTLSIPQRSKKEKKRQTYVGTTSTGKATGKNNDHNGDDDDNDDDDDLPPPSSAKRVMSMNAIYEEKKKSKSRNKN